MNNEQRVIKNEMNSEFLEVQGIKSHITRVGEGDQKLVLLHGWNSDRSWRPIDSFQALAEEIAERNNYEVIVVDLPGFGASDLPPVDGWNTWDYADWLAELLGKLEIKQCSFYGHSFGCRVIIRFLLATLIKGGGGFEINKVILTGAAGIKWPLTMREKISLFLSKKLTFAKSIIPRAIQKFVITKILGARDWGAVPAELKSTLEKVLAEEDFREDLEKIRTQILLVWGNEDAITPLKSGKVYAEKLSNARLEIIQGARHGMHKTHTVEVADFVSQFLKS